MKGCFKVLALLALLFQPDRSTAYPVDLDKLPNQGRNSYGCLVCHLNPAGGELTSFGGDYMFNDYRYDMTLQNKDSDQDGFPNDAELKAQPPSHPGDSASYPFAPPNFLAWIMTVFAVLVPLTGGFLYVLHNGKSSS